MAGGKKMQRQRDSLARFLIYVLGQRPDEFGLFTDEQGWVPLKELLQALGEEEGWKHVREASINELLLDPGTRVVEIQDKMIRATPEATSLRYGPFPEAAPPKLLYHAARRKGYPVILENGLTPVGGKPYVPLFEGKDLAMRVGRRRDSSPVLLTVQTTPSLERGVLFKRPQEKVYLVDKLDPDLFTGPPLPKEKEETPKKKKDAPARERAMPGSFLLDPDRMHDPAPAPMRGKKEKKSDIPDWKRAARKERRRNPK